MKFGRIDPSLLRLEALALPEDPVPWSFPAQEPKPAALYLGCTQWHCPDWVGKIYPRGLKADDTLRIYARSFNTVELNAMHYRIFPEATVARWAALTDPAFKFCPKFPQVISHAPDPGATAIHLQQFLESIRAFGPRLGPAFLQMSESFAPDQQASLWRLLDQLPSDLSFAVELRHPGWFQHAMVQQVAVAFRNRGIGWVITDAPGRRDVCHMHLTAPFTIIRFLGNNLHPTDQPRARAWVERLQQWFDQGLQTAYFFMHHPGEAEAPELIDYMAGLWGGKAGIQVRRPIFLPRQAGLF